MVIWNHIGLMDESGHVYPDNNYWSSNPSLSQYRKQNREMIVILAEHGSKPAWQRDPKSG